MDIGDVQSAVDLEESSFEIRCLRLVEQGCRIVAALDYETQIVLQVTFCACVCPMHVYILIHTWERL